MIEATTKRNGHTAPARASRLVKLRMPAVSRVAPRPRLFRILDRKAPVTWVWGPPGAGKTTLVASYLATRKIPTGWYQFDARDDDLGTFFHYLALLAGDRSARKRSPLPVLSPAHAGGLAAFARGFAEAFFARAPAPFALVLDGYEDVPEAAPLHEILPEVLAMLPPGRRVFVCSRTEPRPALSRLRVSGRLLTIGWSELRLTSAEAMAVARVRGERNLTSARARELVQEAEGWVAGVVLLLHGPDRASGGTAAAPMDATRSAAAFDYFASEVLKGLDPAERETLLALSLLPSVTAAMAAEVADGSGAERVLPRLSARQYFTERPPGAETIYRLHPLFRDFLRARARVELPVETVGRALRVGAAHLADAGEVDEAARLLVEAEDWKTLERITLDHAARLVASGRQQTLLGCLRRLPAEHVRANRWLSYWFGVVGRGLGLGVAREHLARAIEAFEDSDDPKGLASALAEMLDTYFVEWSRYRAIDPWLEKTEALIDRRLREGAELDSRFAASAFRALFFRQPHHPRVPWLRDHLRDLVRRGEPAGPVAAAGLALAYYYAWVGEPQSGVPLVHVARQAAGASAPLMLITADYMEGLVLLKMGQGAACLELAERGLARARTTGVHALDGRLQALGVYGARAVGDADRAGRYLTWLQDRLDASPLADQGHYRFLAGWHAMVRGDLQRGFNDARAGLAIADEVGLPFLVVLNSFLLAQICHERGDSVAAEEHIARVRAIADGMDSHSVRFMSDMVRADLALARGDDAAADALLRDGLGRARARSLGFFAGWRSSVMARLCARALEQGIEVEYARRLVREQRLTADRPPLDVPGWPWAIEIATLGPLIIKHDGEELRCHGRGQQRPLDLLRALVAFGGRQVPAPRLIDALWPGAEGDAGRAALDTTLLRLRRLLGCTSAVIVEEGHVSLDERQCWLDVWQLERLLNGVEQANRRRSGHDGAASLLERIVSLYRGPLLDDTDAPWAHGPRERLRRRIVRVLEALGRAREACGDVEGALTCYLRGLDADDLAEGLYQRAMQCYSSLGRRAEALALYQRCRQQLTNVLGVEPAEETRALHARLRTG